MVESRSQVKAPGCSWLNEGQEESPGIQSPPVNSEQAIGIGKPGLHFLVVIMTRAAAIRARTVIKNGIGVLCRVVTVWGEVIGGV